MTAKEQKENTDKNATEQEDQLSDGEQLEAQDAAANTPETEEDNQQELDPIQLLETEKNKRLQVLADFDNYRKRMENEKATFGAVANMGLIQQILEIVDDMQLALNDEELDLERSKSSIKTAQDKLTAAVQISGVERVQVQVGDEFDKERMEAISTAPDEKNKNKVIAVISSAYKYSNQEGILRPAKVIVGS